MRRRSRRIPRLLILSLVLAHLTTWAVAWGVALTRPMMGYDGASSMLDSCSTPSVEWRYFAMIPTTTSGHALMIESDAFYSKYHPREQWGLETVRWLNQFCKRVATGEIQVGAYPQYEEFAVGWPRLSSWAWRVGPNETQGAIEYGKYGFDAGRLPFRALPYLPIYRGLIINTLFYTLLWLPLLFFTSRTTRAYTHRARAARGQCPNCKYDLKGITHPICPECGHAPIPSRSRER